MKRILPLIIGAMLVWPGAALAQSGSCSSSNQTYGSQTCQVAQNVATSNTSTTASSSTLPFTGLDVSLLVAGGVTLLGAGLVVRYLSRNPSDR